MDIITDISNTQLSITSEYTGLWAAWLKHSLWKSPYLQESCEWHSTQTLSLTGAQSLRMWLSSPEMNLGNLLLSPRISHQGTATKANDMWISSIIGSMPGCKRSTEINRTPDWEITSTTIYDSLEGLPEPGCGYTQSGHRASHKHETIKTLKVVSSAGHDPSDVLRTGLLLD